MKAPKFSKSEIKQEIDLDEFLKDVDLSGAREFKERLGQRIIDYMVNRVKNQGGMKWSDDGKPRSFDLSTVKYSKEYIDSPAYKAFRKTGAVNMTLTGDMLQSIDVLSTDGNKVVIGIDDDEQAPKAYNHQIGDKLRARPFFGVNKREVQDIMRELLPEVRRAVDTSATRTERNQKLLDILDQLDEEEGG